MVRLHREELPSEQLTALFHQLNETISALDTHTASLFLDELLGPEEQIMLAKRLAAIILLLEGTSLYKTSALLHLNPATAQKIKMKIDRNHYAGIISILGKNKRDYFAILDALDSILHLGGLLPHYNGLDRYRI